MKPTLNILLTIFTVALFSTAGNSQDCHNFQKRKCNGSDNPYMSYNNQSKAGMFVMGHTSDLVFVAHSGKDYHISLCQDNKVEEPIKFKVLDGRSEEVIFDNEQAAIDGGGSEGEAAGNPMAFDFSADVTKKIIIRITAPGPPPEEGKGKASKPDPDDLFCVGVLIEDMPTPQLGF